MPLDNFFKLGIIGNIGLFSVPAPPFRFAASGGVFLLVRPFSGTTASRDQHLHHLYFAICLLIPAMIVMAVEKQ